MCLDPLDAEDTAALVRARLHVREVAPSILSLVLDRAGGHPFFAEALVEAMVQSGAIQVTTAGARLGEATPATVPVTVEAAVLARLDGLDARHQLTLKAASIVGRTFSVDEVAAAHPIADRSTVAGELDTLAGEDLLAAVGDSVFGFRHQLIQEVARGLLPEARSRRMHHALASFYEGRAGERPPEHLAHHWLQAGETERAAPYLEQAGHQALHHGAFG